MHISLENASVSEGLYGIGRTRHIPRLHNNRVRLLRIARRPIRFRNLVIFLIFLGTPQVEDVDGGVLGQEVRVLEAPLRDHSLLHWRRAARGGSGEIMVAWWSFKIICL